MLTNGIMLGPRAARLGGHRCHAFSHQLTNAGKYGWQEHGDQDGFYDLSSDEQG